MVKVKTPTKNSRKLVYMERRRQILELAREIGLPNLHISNLAKKYGVDWHTIKNDIKKITECADNESLTEIRFNVFSGVLRTFKEGMDVLSSKDASTKEKLAAGKLVLDATTKLIEHSEAFEVKPKIAEKHEVTGNIETVTAGDIKALYDEVQASKKKR